MNKSIIRSRISQPVAPQHADAIAAFAAKLDDAMADLKNRLREHCERAYPGQAELVRDAIAHAEAVAWEASSFPHLFLPDLVEARMAEVKSKPAFVRSGAAFAHAA